MDANKLKVLQDIGYIIKPSCMTCIHGQFKGTWGTCAAKQYDHLKHADSRRQLSIHMLGVCNGGYKADEVKIADLGRFAEFFRDEK